MEWSSDVAAADWWIERLRPFSDYVVGSMIPAGFDAITRVFHPVEDATGTHVRWSELAAANGRVAHPQMQLHCIASRPGEPIPPEQQPSASPGSLPIEQARTLATILASTGSIGPTWFGFTTIDTRFHQPATAHLPVAGTPSREYFLMRSTLTAFDEVCSFANGGGLDPIVLEAPSIWWPEDRSWFVFSDVDFTFSYVAGNNEVIEAIEQSDDLEAFRSGYDHRGTVDADTINTP